MTTEGCATPAPECRLEVRNDTCGYPLPPMFKPPSVTQEFAKAMARDWEGQDFRRGREINLSLWEPFELDRDLYYRVALQQCVDRGDVLAGDRFWLTLLRDLPYLYDLYAATLWGWGGRGRFISGSAWYYYDRRELCARTFHHTSEEYSWGRWEKCMTGLGHGAMGERGNRLFVLRRKKHSASLQRGR